VEVAAHLQYELEREGSDELDNLRCRFPAALRFRACGAQSAGLSMTLPKAVTAHPVAEKDSAFETIPWRSSS